MKLYKYYSYKERNEETVSLNFFENCKFRFTQLKYLNDKFEGNWVGLYPSMSIADLEKEKKEMRKSFADHNTCIDKNMIEFFNSKIPSLTMNPIDFPGLFFDKDIVFDVDINRRRMTDKANGYGLFCLTTSNLNQLMWCHYGDNEKGLCIEFDGEHPYFKKRTRKVLYSQKRPMVKPLLKNEKLPETEIEEFILKSILVKNRIWIHEDEHRLITSISDLEPKKNENEDVYLGTIPYDSIRSITFGSGTEYSVKQTIWKNKLHLKEWNHLKLFELVKNEKQYGYKVFPLN